jgi:very-short-patch-repair endonuclease
MSVEAAALVCVLCQRLRGPGIYFDERELRLIGLVTPTLLDQCESPIERQLLGELIEAGVIDPLCGSARAIGASHFKSASADPLLWFSQHHVRIEEIRYRLDFAAIGAGGMKLCIECDGHNFHERTKEQAKRDRSRDRALQRDGWRVLRFAGTELHGDAAKCVDEIAKELRLHAKRLLLGGAVESEAVR